MTNLQLSLLFSLAALTHAALRQLETQKITWR